MEVKNQDQKSMMPYTVLNVYIGQKIYVQIENVNFVKIDLNILEEIKNEGKMIKYILLIMCGLLLVSCSSPPQQRIDSSNSVQSCTVFGGINSRYECLFTDGNIYYISTLRVSQITKYDPSAWRENVAYCPQDINLTSLTNTSLQCPIKKVCYNGERWQECP